MKKRETYLGNIPLFNLIRLFGLASSLFSHTIKTIHMPLLTLEIMKARLDQFYYKDWELNIYEGAFEGIKFEVKAVVEDTTNPGHTVPLHIVSPITGFFDLEQFDYHIAKVLCRIEVHECLENFKFKDSDMCVFSPHVKNADRDLLHERG